MGKSDRRGRSLGACNSMPGRMQCLPVMRTAAAFLLAQLGCADAFTLCTRIVPHGASGVNLARAAVSAIEPSPPEGFTWADTERPVDASKIPVEASSSADGIKASSEVMSSASSTQVAEGVVTRTQTEPAKPQLFSDGIFAPLVKGAKRVMGDQELKKLRADVIAKHSKVIANFVDTSESKFGKLVLRRMFEYADKDGNGTLDKEEVRAALLDLGFDFVDEKQVSNLMRKADADKNEVIDFEEFVKETPKALRTNLVKLAKKNGHDLGFLV